MSGKTIVVLATLDTKGVEAQYVREKIEHLGEKALVVDVGVVGQPAARADVTRQEVAEAGGMPLAKLLENPDREVAAPLMAEGATRIVEKLAEQGKVHGILSMGGTQGTTLATSVMRALPYGFPKVMVSFPPAREVTGICFRLSILSCIRVVAVVVSLPIEVEFMTE